MNDALALFTPYGWRPPQTWRPWLLATAKTRDCTAPSSSPLFYGPLHNPQYLTRRVIECAVSEQRLRVDIELNARIAQCLNDFGPWVPTHPDYEPFGLRCTYHVVIPPSPTFRERSRVVPFGGLGSPVLPATQIQHVKAIGFGRRLGDPCIINIVVGRGDRLPQRPVAQPLIKFPGPVIVDTHAKVDRTEPGRGRLFLSPGTPRGTGTPRTTTLLLR